MKRWMLTVLSVPLTLLAVCGSAAAHHGASAYDRTVSLTLKATITEFVFRNPHIILSFDAPDDAGRIVHWVAEGGSSSGLARRGWTYKTLKAGDQVTVEGNPAKGMESKDKRVMAMTKVILANGQVVGQQTLTP
ncbi:MAG: DUF6152 family protein [Acidobacteriota bacterium]